MGYGHIASNCPTKRTIALNLKREVESEHSSPPSPNQANEDQNKVKDKRKDEKEKEQVTFKVLLASKKIFPKQDGHHHSSFSCKSQKEDPMRKHGGRVV